MKFVKQASALAGFFFGAALLLSDSVALAYGQQWRPAGSQDVNYAAADPRYYRRTANVPNFRPQAPRLRQAYRDPATRYARPRGAQARAHDPVYARAEAYPAPRYAYLPPPPPPQVMPAYAALPPWARPFTDMAHAWQYQVPLFSRQFAWRPAERPWIAREASARSAARPAQDTPRYAARSPGFRPGTPAYPQSVAGWRPHSVSRAPAYAQYGYVPPVRPVATYAAVPPVSAAGERAGAHAAGHGRGQQWRPAGQMYAANWAQRSAFRPAGYGRALAGTEVAPQAAIRAGPARAELPGWVTTHGDADLGTLGCDWCSGS